MENLTEIHNGLSIIIGYTLFIHLNSGTQYVILNFKLKFHEILSKVVFYQINMKNGVFIVDTLYLTLGVSFIDSPLMTICNPPGLSVNALTMC